MSNGNSFVDQGWDPVAFGRRMSRRYEIEDMETGRWHKMGDLFAKAPHQQRFIRTAIKHLRRGGPVRLVVLKGRKSFISTSTAALFYDIVTHVPSTRAGVLAHKGDSTNILFNMVDNFWKRTHPTLRPQKKRHNGTTIEFGARYKEQIEAGEIGLDSMYECATGGGNNPFTAGSYRCIHISEAGKMPGDKKRQSEMLTSVLNAVPPQGPSIVVMESTAQGADNLFHSTWVQAEKNVENGREPQPGEWIPVFIGWHENPLNRSPIEKNYDWEDWKPEDIKHERELIKLYFGGDFRKAAPALRWRRKKISEINNDFDKFDEDFPHCPRVAFLRTSQPAIPPGLFGYTEELIARPLRTYSLSLEESDEARGSEAIAGW